MEGRVNSLRLEGVCREGRVNTDRYCGEGKEVRGG